MMQWFGGMAPPKLQEIGPYSFLVHAVTSTP